MTDYETDAAVKVRTAAERGRRSGRRDLDGAEEYATLDRPSASEELARSRESLQVREDAVQSIQRHRGRRGVGHARIAAGHCLRLNR